MFSVIDIASQILQSGLLPQQVSAFTGTSYRTFQQVCVSCICVLLHTNRFPE